MRSPNEITLEEWFDGIPDDGPVADNKVERLSWFVQGFELDLASNEEPFVLLYDSAVFLRAVSQLTSAAAGLLKRWLDGKWKPSLRERGHYNLLHLCIETGDGSRLGDHLWTLYRQKPILGHYQSLRPIDMREALLGAMARNPVGGDEPARFWQELVDGKPDGYLGGSRLDGFVGMLYALAGLNRQDKIVRLARCLLTIHNQLDENIFLSALSALQMRQPAIAEDVLRRAGLDFCSEYDRIVRERGRQLADKASNNIREKEDLTSDYNEFICTLREEIGREMKARRLPTRMQFESLYTRLLIRAFWGKQGRHYRRALILARGLARLREPQPLRVQLQEELKV